MKFFVRNVCIFLLIVLLCTISAIGQTKCTCRPSPPGGTTRCVVGQTAVCGSDRSGTCEGSCINVRPSLQAIEYVASLLSQIAGVDIPAPRLREEASTFRSIISAILRSNRDDEAVTIKYHDKIFQVSIDLTSVGVSKLEEALNQLER